MKSKYDNLMQEVEWLRQVNPSWGILEALVCIRDNAGDFPEEVRVELREFMREGQRLVGAAK